MTSPEPDPNAVPPWAVGAYRPPEWDQPSVWVARRGDVPFDADHQVSYLAAPFVWQDAVSPPDRELSRKLVYVRRKPEPPVPNLFLGGAEAARERPGEFGPHWALIRCGTLLEQNRDERSYVPWERHTYEDRKSVV